MPSTILNLNISMQAAHRYISSSPEAWLPNCSAKRTRWGTQKPRKCIYASHNECFYGGQQECSVTGHGSLEGIGLMIFNVLFVCQRRG
ncbi:hypothetical protein PM082_024221 [Marasmius tenuissimus]|nr:hypothetical protein PM082_024221 [Marasmius tenuissimus]